MPDEELGGHDGMAKYVLTKEFKELNIGLAIDEGLASPDEVIPLFYGERNVFWVTFKCMGKLQKYWQFYKQCHRVLLRPSVLTTHRLAYLCCLASVMLV